MKSLAKNPLFYLSLALALALGFQIYSIAGAAWKEPSSGPPGPADQPAAPLDTSAFPQKKEGNLMIGVAATPNVEVQSRPSPKLLFRESGSSVGQIYFAAGKLMAANADGVSFEIGKGGGESLWQKVSGTDNIFYDKGDVRIVSQIRTKTVYYYEATGEVVSGHPKPRLSCDVDDNVLDLACGGLIYAGETKPSADVAYDWYDGDRGFLEAPSFLVPRANAANPLAKAYRLVERTETEVFKNNKLVASDIDLVSPRWAAPVSGATFYNAPDGVEPRLAPVGATGIGSGRRVLSVIIDRSSRCPDGQFVVGVQLREWNGALALGVECASF